MRWPNPIERFVEWNKSGHVVKVINAWVGLSWGLPGTGSITQVSVSLTVSCLRLVEEVGVGGVARLDDDLVAAVQSKQPSEGLAVGHPIARERKVASLTGLRSRGVVPHPLGEHT